MTTPTRTRAGTVASLTLAAPVLVALLALAGSPACGGKATGDGTSGDDAGSSSGDPASQTDSGLAPGCPTEAPVNGGPCATAGLVCDYAQAPSCGKFTCDASAHEWQGQLSQRSCALPEGFTCPTPESQKLVGATPPVDVSCTLDSDCASVKFAFSCCGDTLAFGVNAKSVAAATSAAQICQSGFPACGCPSQGTKAEVGEPPDGGQSFDPAIDAFCNQGTCKTRYR